VRNEGKGVYLNVSVKYLLHVNNTFEVSTSKKDLAAATSFLLGGGGEIRTPAPDLSGLTI
jgi:hypothetical protein